MLRVDFKSSHYKKKIVTVCGGELIKLIVEIILATYSYQIIKIYKYIKHKYIKQIQCCMSITSQFLKKLNMNGTKNNQNQQHLMW